jgi:hypothetical protein
LFKVLQKTLGRTGQGQAGTSFCNIETRSLILGWNWELVFGLQTSLGSLFDWVGNFFKELVFKACKLPLGLCLIGLETSSRNLLLGWRFKLELVFEGARFFWAQLACFQVGKQFTFLDFLKLEGPIFTR